MTKWPKGKQLLYVDENGTCIRAASVKELAKKAGGGKVQKVYIDKLDGRVVHIGYCVGRRWFRAFQPVEVEA